MREIIIVLERSYRYDQVTQLALQLMNESKDGPFFLNQCADQR